MANLSGRVALVAGASRGAGRGIALALGEAGATVYVSGRTVRGGPPPMDGAAGTIEDTAAEVTARGGVGIPVQTDHTSEADVVALFERIAADHGRLHVLANAVWGGHDGVRSGEEWMASMGVPFWDKTAAEWQHMMMAGPYAYWLTTCHALRMMTKVKTGLVVGVTDFVVAGANPDEYGGGGQLMAELAHTTINRLMKCMSVEAKPKRIAVITLMPGFMRTERVQLFLPTDKLKKMFRYDLSETPEYLGRAVAALAADRNALAKTGTIQFVADLATEYGFTDADGKVVPRFAPFG